MAASSPTLKFSTSTSLAAARRLTISLPSGALRFTVTLFLLRLMQRKYALSPPAKGGPQWRVSSPAPGRSILITSAPRSPSIIVQNGPARILEMSSTLRPPRARCIGNPPPPPPPPGGTGPAPPLSWAARWLGFVVDPEPRLLGPGAGAGAGRAQRRYEVLV